MGRFKRGDKIQWKVGRKEFFGEVTEPSPSIAPGAVGVRLNSGEGLYPLRKYVKRRR